MQDTFRIGDAYHIEPSLNRVTGPNGITRLEPKVMEILVCLAALAGQVVPKDRLLHAAWADTAVGLMAPLGHAGKESPWGLLVSMQSIHREAGKLRGVSEPRGFGLAKGY